MRLGIQHTFISTKAGYIYTYRTTAVAGTCATTSTTKPTTATNRARPWAQLLGVGLPRQHTHIHKLYVLTVTLTGWRSMPSRSASWRTSSCTTTTEVHRYWKQLGFVSQAGPFDLTVCGFFVLAQVSNYAPRRGSTLSLANRNRLLMIREDERCGYERSIGMCFSTVNDFRE